MSDTGGRIDWEAVHTRLEESQRALDRVLNTDADNLAAIYRERAARLAGRRAQAAAPATTLRILVFTLGPERYALEFADLVELLPFGNCTPVPGGAPQLLGVINFHGEIRSVVDLGRLLDLPAAHKPEAPAPGPGPGAGASGLCGDGPGAGASGLCGDGPGAGASGLWAGDGSAGGYVLVVRKQGREVGLRVDGLDNIRLLDPRQLAVPGDGEAGAALRFLRGLTPDRLRLLNMEAVLGHPIFT